MFGSLLRRNASSWVGKWALFPWFKEKGERHVAPEDLMSMEELQPYGKVFCCKAAEAGFVVIGLSRREFRVTPHLLVEVPEPEFKFGDSVRPVDEPDRVGSIASISWHFKEKRPVFQIVEGHKIRSRRYWAENLRRDELIGDGAGS